MQTLHRIARRDMTEVEPLPYPFDVFRKHKLSLIPGELSLMMGGPGARKTILALNMVRKMGVSTLYHSNDSTSYTVVTRAIAMLSNKSVEWAEKLLKTDKAAAAMILKSWDRTHFSFYAKPSIGYLANEAEAHRELYGAYPRLVVVDIMMNLDHEGVAEQNYWRVSPELKELAQAHKAAYLVVHHTSLSVKYDGVPPESAAMGKATQLPALVISQAIDQLTGDIRVGAVKNRNGPSDTTGNSYFHLPNRPENCFVDEAESDEIHEKDGINASKEDWFK